MVKMSKVTQENISFQSGPSVIEGSLVIPDGARGVVLFAHGTGSSRNSPRNRFVAQELNDAGLATLLIDLLTQEEATGLKADELRFDIVLLAQRLESAIEWLSQYQPTRNLSIGLFGASTGAAAALVAAAEKPDTVKAVVSRGGRPEMAGPALSAVKAPVLLIVGGRDLAVLRLNKAAADELFVEKDIKVIAGASHLFEEPNALEKVARFAASWFARYLK
ncbi:MAG: dienelactone hydrolase family protein [Thermoleophilia bacterium]